MDRVRTLLSRWPRAFTGLALAVATGLTTFLAWTPSARFSGAIPALTLGAALAHGIAGALTGHRLFDRARTSSAAAALRLGAVASLLALALFAPVFTLYVMRDDPHPGGPLNFLALMFYVAIFSFAGAGWALLLVSAGVAWVLWKLAR